MTKKLWTTLAGCLCLAASAPVLAVKWELVAQGNTGFYYIDPRSIESDGDRKRVWTVLDYREEQKLQDGARYRSTHAQVQFNCKARLARLVHLTYHSGPMREGSVVLRQGMLQDWFEIEAGSPMQRMAGKVC
jgi:hypothetical protein